MSNHYVNYTLYIASLPLNAHDKSVLHNIAAIRLRGDRCQPGYKRLAIWISRGTRTVGRAVKRLEDDGWIWRKRRGKKLTNLYYLSQYLFRLLTRGRKWAGKRVEKKSSEVTHGNPQLSLLELFAAELRAK